MVSPIGTKASEEQCYMGTYHSTRGRTLSCSSKVAIRTGIAPDGGLFVSDELGTQQVDISSLADKSYFEIAQDVLGMLLNDYTAEEISACVDEAYRGTFASEEVTPLVKLDAAPGADAPQTYVMELYGGTEGVASTILDGNAWLLLKPGGKFKRRCCLVAHPDRQGFEGLG